MDPQQQGRQMLVLGRKVGETIVVGHEIRVTVVSVKGDVIRLGIDAPKDVEVDREEIREAKERDRE